MTYDEIIECINYLQGREEHESKLWIALTAAKQIVEEKRDYMQKKSKKWEKEQM